MSSSFKRRNQPAASIPAASSFIVGGVRGVRKLGRLSKLCPRGGGWLLGTCCWKRRFCVLDGTKLYYYDSETSTGKERACGVLSLDYFDLCEEGKRKDKRASNIFVISTSVRGIFDLQQKHTFAADTLPEMNEWIHYIRSAISDARNKRTRRGNESSANSLKGVKTTRESPIPEVLPSEQVRLYTPTKNRARGPKGRRLPQRKSMMPNRGRDAEDGPIRANSMSALEYYAEDEVRKDAWLDLASESRRSASNDIYKYSSSEDSLLPAAASKVDDNNDKSRTLPHNNSLPPVTTTLPLSSDASQNAKPEQIKRINSNGPPSTRYKDLTFRLNQLEKRLEGLESEVAVSRADIATVHSQVGRTQKEVDKAAAKITEIRETSSLQEGEILTVMKEIKELFVDASKMKAESEQARDEFLRLRKECTDALAEIKKSQTSV